MGCTVAIIGGTGVYDPDWVKEKEERAIHTPFGEAALTLGTLKEAPTQSVAFMNRHGLGHAVPPHQINYRANLWALSDMGIKRVVATAAVGSLNVAMPPGSMVLVDQFLDFTKMRISTFFDGTDGPVVHTDMTNPYCPESRQRVLEAGQREQAPIIMGGVYVTTEGPRFETPAEIRAYRLLGGDVVGMTSVPEVVLARELGLCYVTIAMVTNYAAGMAAGVLTHQEVLDVMAANQARLRQILLRALPDLDKDNACAFCPASPPLSDA